MGGACSRQQTAALVLPLSPGLSRRLGLSFTVTTVFAEGLAAVTDQGDHMDKIIVGSDGSPGAAAAVRWAAADAQRRNAELLIIESWREPRRASGPWLASEADIAARQIEVAAELETATEQLRVEYADVSISCLLSEKRPADALIAESADAVLAVVGARGLGGFANLLLGSVARQVSSAAACPVVVVRDELRQGGVVVGVDGSPSGRAALGWAAADAARRGVPLHAVMAWSYLLPEGEQGSEPFRPDYSADEAKRVLDTIITEVLGGEHGLELRAEAVNDLVPRALLERGDHAALLVVGPGEPSLRHRIDLGSVTAQLLQHATTDLAIIR